MSIEMLEREVAELKQRVLQLEGVLRMPLTGRDAKAGWRGAVGMMKDCDLLDEAVRLGAEFRSKANTEGR
jgi:hypothetical protein